MARSYKYVDARTGRLLFETVQPNYVSDTDVDLMVLDKTGRDPRIERGTIDRTIRVVPDSELIKPKKKRANKKRR